MEGKDSMVLQGFEEVGEGVFQGFNGLSRVWVAPGF